MVLSGSRPIRKLHSAIPLHIGVVNAPLCSEEDEDMNATIVEEKGTHLLIRRGDRFAIIERRNNRLYNCHSGKRDGIAADDLSALVEIVDGAD